MATIDRQTGKIKQWGCTDTLALMETGRLFYWWAKSHGLEPYIIDSDKGSWIGFRKQEQAAQAGKG